MSSRERSDKMSVYAVAKPDAYVVKSEEAKKIADKGRDQKKHEKMLVEAKRFESLCLKKKD